MINIAGNEDLVKDAVSSAILNKNVSLLQEHKNKKMFFNTLSTRMNAMERQLAEMNKTLKDLVGKNNG